MSKVMEIIERIVCDGEDIPPILLHTESRKREISETRQIIMFLASKVGVPERKAGDYYDRDHSTANHAKKKIKNMRKNPGRMGGEFNDKILVYEAKLNKYLPQELGYFDLITLIEADITSAENRIVLLKNVLHRIKTDRGTARDTQDAEVLAAALLESGTVVETLLRPDTYESVENIS